VLVTWDFRILWSYQRRWSFCKILIIHVKFHLGHFPLIIFLHNFMFVGSIKSPKVSSFHWLWRSVNSMNVGNYLYLLRGKYILRDHRYNVIVLEILLQTSIDRMLHCSIRSMLVCKRISNTISIPNSTTISYRISREVQFTIFFLLCLQKLVWYNDSW
jgi:hypothetical protein